MRFVSASSMACWTVVIMQTSCLTWGTHAPDEGGPTRPGCSLTMQNNTLAQTCGELVLRNSGTVTMQGWEIRFTLKNGGRLINAWNGTFTAEDSAVTVHPSENNYELAPGDTTTLGYCASGPTTNIELLAGSCVFGGDPNDGGDPESVPSHPGFTDNFATLDANRWSVRDGIDSTCNLNPNNIGFSEQGLLQQAVADSTPEASTCGALISTDTYLFGHFEATLQAAAAVSVTTRLATGVQTPSGLQGISMQITGNQSHTLVLTVWHDGIAHTSVQSLAFDATAALHPYGFTWQADSIVFSVDGVAIQTVRNDLPAAIGQHIVLDTQPIADAPPSSGASRVRALTYAP